MPIDWDNWLNDADSHDIRLSDSGLSTDDRELQIIWECAFPSGLKYREWIQLIYLMVVIDHESHPMSSRTIAHNIGVLLNVQYVYLLHEVYGAYQITPHDKVIVWLKNRLQQCGYYDWLKEDSNIAQTKIGMLDDLCKQLINVRPCKRLTLKRKSIPALNVVHDQETINTFVKLMLSLNKEWKGIKWHELRPHVMWEELIRILQYDREHTTRHMSRKEAHAFIGAITKLLNDDDETTKYFTNHRGGGLWTPLSDTKWQYWLITASPSSIGILGIEED